MPQCIIIRHFTVLSNTIRQNIIKKGLWKCTINDLRFIWRKDLVNKTVMLRNPLVNQASPRQQIPGWRFFVHQHEIWRNSCLTVQKKRCCIADLCRLYNTSYIHFNGGVSYAVVPDSISLHLQSNHKIPFLKTAILMVFWTHSVTKVPVCSETCS